MQAFCRFLVGLDKPGDFAFSCDECTIQEKLKTILMQFLGGCGALNKTYCAQCENWRPIETRFQQFQICFLRKKGEKKKDLNALH